MKSTLRLPALLALVLVGSALANRSWADPIRVRIETGAGNIVVQLAPDRAPLTVKNFLQYARDGFYDGTIFHRVVTGFVIQGGGFDEKLTLKPARSTVPNESGNGLSNRRGTIAMARSADPHSADAQFYINLADNLMLDPKPTRWGYTVFGEVVEGMDVVDDIGHRATIAKGELHEIPAEPVVIRRVVVLSGAAP